LNDPAAVFVDRWAYQSAAQSPQSFKRSNVIQPNQVTVTDHVGIDHGDQLAPARCPSNQV
jgi:hypothetical protein